MIIHFTETRHGIFHLINLFYQIIYALNSKGMRYIIYNDGDILKVTTNAYKNVRQRLIYKHYYVL